MLRLFAILLLITTTLLALDPAQSKSNQMIEPGKIVVKYKQVDSYGSVNKSAKVQLSTKYALNAEKPLFEKARNQELKQKLNLNNVFVYRVPASTDIFNLAAKLTKENEVEYAEPVYISKADATPNDPRYSDQQHLPQISAPEAWDDQYGSDGVIIGVIDSGVDWDHEDLAGVIWTNDDEVLDGTDTDGNGYVDDIRGWDFVDDRDGTGETSAVPEEDGDEPDNDPMDFGGHGSHVAGIAAAHTNNSTGIASVSSGARIMPLRIGWQARDGNGYGSSDFMAQAHIYAADNGAHITNLSYGNSGQVLIDAAYYAFLNGVLVVESAGNNNNSVSSALGSQHFTISVASLDPDDGKSSFSNFGSYIDVSAPGASILSTVVEPSSFYAGKYARFSGTSMAAPLVASVAGLVKAKYPTINVIELYSRVVETADNIDDVNGAFTGMLGTGKVNVARAMSEDITAKPNIQVNDFTISEITGNSNGILEPGEQANLEVEIQNIWAEGSNITAQLSALSSWPITIDDGSETITNIANLLDTTNSKQTLTFTITCAESGFPSTVEMELELTGADYSQTLSFQLGISPQLLFVADFEEANGGDFDFSSLYFEDFQDKNIAYDYVHRLNTEITYDLLSNYNIVVWACEWTFPSLTESDRNALEQYLDNGGSLFLSGQDIGWDLNENADNQDVQFFNDYLKSTYLADDVGESKVFGVEGDPISDGIETPFFQIRRPASSQYPDELEELGGSVPLFEYSGGTAGAIRYNGDYKLVYFGFGGYESLIEDDTRRTIMKRIINWFSGINYELSKLPDTEETETDFDVSLSVDTEKNISSAILYYATNGEFPFQFVDMNAEGSGVFTATIPGQPEGTDVEYFANIRSSDGYNTLTETQSFYVGADTQAPVLEVLSNPIRNSINRFGIAPFELHVNLTDNFAIDTSTAYLNYWINDQEDLNSIPLMDAGNDIFAGTFEFDDILDFGDNVHYYFSVSDRSSNANTTFSDTVTYMIDSTQVIDDFELPFLEWTGDENWGLSTTSKNGDYSLSDSPVASYENNSNTTIVYDQALNLSAYKAGELSYYVKSLIEQDADSLLLEISSDEGNSWQTLDFVSSNLIFFTQRFVDITPFTGSGYESVQLRFRLSTNESSTADGVYIDDIVVSVSPGAISSVNNLDQIPKTFELSQNYPNPFNPATTIKFGLPVNADVNITIYNVLGQVVEVLADKKMSAGSYSVNFNSKNYLSSGIYFYRINAQGEDGRDFVQTKKMILIK